MAAIEIIDELVPIGGADFPLMASRYVKLPDGSLLSNNVVLPEKTLPEDNVALPNKMYILGEVAELSVGFSDGNNIGDMVLVSFSAGDTKPTLTFTTDNYIGLDNISGLSNRYYELIGLWNGSVWVFVKYEVAL